MLVHEDIRCNSTNAVGQHRSSCGTAWSPPAGLCFQGRSSGLGRTLNSGAIVPIGNSVLSFITMLTTER